MNHLVEFGTEDFSGRTRRNTVGVLESSGGRVRVDAALGDYFTLSLAENVTAWEFVNVPPACSLLIEITQAAQAVHDVVWPENFTWPDGSSSRISTIFGAKDVLTLSSFDQGGCWRCTLATNFRAPSADPHWANVVSLLNAPAVLGTEIVDAKGKSWRVHGDVQVAASLGYAALKFMGEPSYISSGNEAYLETPYSEDWNLASGDFTLEGYVLLNTSTYGVSCYPLFSKAGNEGSDTITIYAEYFGDVSAEFHEGQYWYGVGPESSIPLDTLVHWAVVREGENMHVYIDGTPIGSGWLPKGILLTDETPIRIGMRCQKYDGWDDPQIDYFNGCLVAFRATKGVCRYPGGKVFMPPAFPFPEGE
ncbi:MAG: LamG domain-containing protein [Candidatus Accumulibacter sp.]|jgi:hypothetical protein|nr:LamG domain-containing protein [Accumulibacter sp.]